MHRRSFIGRVLGTIIVSQLPFVGREQQMRNLTKLDQWKKTLELFDLSESDLTKIKGFYRLKNDETIKTTNISQVSKDIKNMSINFIFEDWKATQVIEVKTVGILLPDSYLLREKECSVTMEPLDVFKTNYSISMP